MSGRECGECRGRHKGDRQQGIAGSGEAGTGMDGQGVGSRQWRAETGMRGRGRQQGDRYKIGSRHGGWGVVGARYRYRYRYEWEEDK